MAEFLDWLKIGLGCMIGLMIMFVFEHSPIGDSAKLQSALTSSAACTVQKNADAADLTQCKVNMAAATSALQSDQTNAATALNSAQIQCGASTKASFNAGVIAGRVIEKRIAANVSTSSSASASAGPVTDDGMSDFATLWNSAASGN